jgi:DNA polymerase IV
MGGRTVVLKLKTHAFRTVTRQVRLVDPTNLADVIHRVAEPMLLREIPQGPFRLLGVGLSALADLPQGGPAARLFADQSDGQARLEEATDRIRGRFGKDAIIRGRALR